jgi:hypothetical protein
MARGRHSRTDRGGGGMRTTSIWHPIIGDGYYPINDEELEIELAGADIVESNAMFEAFMLICSEI